MLREKYPFLDYVDAPRCGPREHDLLALSGDLHFQDIHLRPDSLVLLLRDDPAGGQGFLPGEITPGLGELRFILTLLVDAH